MHSFQAYETKLKCECPAIPSYNNYDLSVMKYIIHDTYDRYMYFINNIPLKHRDLCKFVNIAKYLFKIPSANCLIFKPRTITAPSFLLNIRRIS